MMQLIVVYNPTKDAKNPFGRKFWRKVKNIIFVTLIPDYLARLRPFTNKFMISYIHAKF